MGIQLNNIERQGEYKHAEKFQFVYSDYHPFPVGTLYKTVYTKDKKEVFVDTKGRQIIPLKNNTLFNQYKLTRGSSSRESYFTPHKVIITKEDINRGFKKRYFAKYLLDGEGTIFEISPTTYEDGGKLYEMVDITWAISGIKQEVENINRYSVLGAERKLSGIRYHLANPLEFYQEKENPESITRKKLERLLHNPHSYASKERALSVATSMGLSGVHQMPNGNWMPGSTHEEYNKSLSRGKTITTNTGVSIVTDNIRGSSGY